jgi:GT2 family glycosyltransferase
VRVSAYVPCFNNARTVVPAAESLRAQSIAPDEVFVVDDGSTDDSSSIAEKAGFRVIRLGSNHGRGAARARAISEARGEFVLSCDATMTLAPNFLETIIKWFDDPRVAAAFGRVMDPAPRGASGRWRSRHLLKCEMECSVSKDATFSTWGALMRRSAAIAVGNFDPKCRHTEDAEIGGRLKKAGHDVLFVPEARVFTQGQNSVAQLLERYWRWHVGREEEFTLGRYFAQLLYSARAMAALDLKAGDPLSAMISLLTPHYFLWRRLRKESR